ncbi:hypothetical protein EDD15DRAFT_2198461 [Pisolithus albus]|nr:hypothetical protein EDD15DRAFT_2198461 [Pisolithus albus]
MDNERADHSAQQTLIESDVGRCNRIRVAEPEAGLKGRPTGNLYGLHLCPSAVGVEDSTYANAYSENSMRNPLGNCNQVLQFGDTLMLVTYAFQDKKGVMMVENAHAGGANSCYGLRVVQGHARTEQWAAQHCLGLSCVEKERDVDWESQCQITDEEERFCGVGSGSAASALEKSGQADSHRALNTAMPSLPSVPLHVPLNAAWQIRGLQQMKKAFVGPIGNTIAKRHNVVAASHLNTGVGMVRRGKAQSKEAVVGGPTRRSTRPTAGQGGAIAQLERVGKAVETPHRLRKPQVVLSGDESINPMAPTARRGRKAPCSARTASQAQDECAYTSTGAEDSGSRFGLQTDGSQLPSFVGTQSLRDYEQSRTGVKHVSTEGLSSTTQDRVSGSSTEVHHPSGSFPDTSRGKNVARKQRLGGNSGRNLSVVPEADNFQESDTDGGNDGREEVRDGGDPFDDSPADRWGNEQHSQHWSDDEQNTLPSPVIRSDDETDTQRDVHLNFFGGEWWSLRSLNTNTHQSDDALSPLSSPSAKSVTQTQPLPRATSKQPAQQRQHPSQEGLPSRPPHNFRSQSVCGPPVPSRLPSSRQGVSLQPTVTSRRSEQVQSNVPQQGVSWNREPSRPPTPGLSHSLSPAASRRTTDRQAIGVRRSGIHETCQVNQEPGIDYDVLGRHHSFNSCRRSPSPTYLRDDRRPSKKIRPDATSSDQQLAAEEMMDVDGAGAKSGKCGRPGHSRSTVVPKPTTLAFYPPLWMKLLDDAKARMRLHVATEEPFLRLETAVDGQCSEIIIELVVKYQEDGSELEAGFYPQHKRSMARMLFNDTQTFRSEIKKLAARIVPIEYNLSAPKSATTEHERLEAVKQKAATFLEGAKFLRGECDSLVHSVLSTYERHGFPKAESLNVGELEDSYKRLLVLMDTVALDTYHGPKLTAMLEDWAQTGMTGFTVKDPIPVKQGDWEVILD